LNRKILAARHLRCDFNSLDAGGANTALNFLALTAAPATAFIRIVRDRFQSGRKCLSAALMRAN